MTLTCSFLEYEKHEKGDPACDSRYGADMGGMEGECKGHHRDHCDDTAITRYQGENLNQYACHGHRAWAREQWPEAIETVIT